MFRGKKIGLISFAVLIAVFVTIGFSQVDVQAADEYPEQNIDFYIPFGVGGGADVQGRTIANLLESELGVPVIPQNVTGGGGAVMYEELNNSDPDGYTLGWNSTSILTTTNMGTARMNYDDFENIARVQVTDMPLVVRADDDRFSNLEEFVEYAKENRVTIVHAGDGSATHLLSIAIASELDIIADDIPLGAERRVASLLGGETDAVVSPLPEIEEQVVAGNFKVLGFPSPDVPEGYEDAPTFSELGYDLELQLFRGISVPKGTPDEIIEILVDAVKRSAESDDYKARAEEMGFRISFSHGEEFQQYLAEQNELIKEAMLEEGIHRTQQ